VNGLDTNVLVRYLVRDDPDQAAVATRLIDEGAEGGDTFFISVVVICETVWVLESGYRYSRPVVADTVEKLLLTRQLEFEARDDLWRALHRYREGPADLADYLIGQRNRSNGCRHTWTFDRVLQGDDAFRAPG
jgi:predicted nucleic-acid-binding protein